MSRSGPFAAERNIFGSLVVASQRRNANSRKVWTGGHGERSDFTTILPQEISLVIFGMLDAESLFHTTRVCHAWRDLLEDAVSIWKRHYITISHYCPMEVEKNRLEGFSLKAIVMKNYVLSRQKRAWSQGVFSYIRSISALPAWRMCPMDVETWGGILQGELNRSSW
uniref:F-box only protein 48 n=1 Tax=Myxine glutinosa TaxID=7769 RepID=UPI00358F21E0